MSNPSSSPKALFWHFKIIGPIAVLLLGMAAAWGLMKSHPPLEAKIIQADAPRVEVLRVEPHTLKLNVHSQGVVTPRNEIDWVAEVSGKLVQLHPSWVAGGFFAEGDVLALIDPRDYDAAIAQAEARLAEAKRLLAQEMAQAAQAESEWQALGDGEATPLALHQPQLAEAQAKLKAAEADIVQARLKRSRCELKAPFSGRIRDKTAGLGQYIQSGQKLARVYATDLAEIRLPLALDQLAYLDLPLGNQAKLGPKVSLSAELAGKMRHWSGRIVRTEGVLDQNTGLLNAVAQVQNPYVETGDQPPLLAGLFVQAEIEGVDRSDVFILPPSAVNTLQETLTLDPEDRLHSRKLNVLRHEADRILVMGGLNEGDRVVIGGIQVAVEGVKVSVIDQPGSTAAGRP